MNNGDDMNSSIANQYGTDGATLLKVLRETRERTLTALRQEREAAVARVAEIDAMLSEVDGIEGRAFAPKRRPRTPNQPGGTARVLALVASQPGIARRDLMAAYGANPAAAHTAISVLRRAGKIRQEGSKGSYRMFPVVEDTAAAQ
jgi:hypothetical protein